MYLPNLPVNNELLASNNIGMIHWEQKTGTINIWRVGSQEKEPTCEKYAYQQWLSAGPHNLWEILKRQKWYSIEKANGTIAVNCTYLKGIILTPNMIAFRVNALWFNLKREAVASDLLVEEFECVKKSWQAGSSTKPPLMSIEKEAVKIAFPQCELACLDLNLAAKAVIFHTPVMPNNHITMEYSHPSQALTAHQKWRESLVSKRAWETLEHLDITLTFNLTQIRDLRFKSDPQPRFTAVVSSLSFEIGSNIFPQEFVALAFERLTEVWMRTTGKQKDSTPGHGIQLTDLHLHKRVRTGEKVKEEDA